MIRGFSCTALTHVWKLHGTNEGLPLVVWRCYRKQKNRLIQFILHPDFELSLSHICRRVWVESITLFHSQSLEKNDKKSAATSDFCQEKLLSESLHFQLWRMSLWRWSLMTFSVYFWLTLKHKLLTSPPSQQPIRSTLLHQPSPPLFAVNVLLYKVWDTKS